jgi:hypothetical protein
LKRTIDDSNSFHIDGDLAYQVSKNLIRVLIFRNGEVKILREIITPVFNEKTYPGDKYTEILYISGGKIYNKSMDNDVDIYLIDKDSFELIKTLDADCRELVVYEGRIYTLEGTEVKVYDEVTLELFSLLSSESIGIKLVGNFLVVGIKKLKASSVEMINYESLHRYYAHGGAYTALNIILQCNIMIILDQQDLLPQPPMSQRRLSAEYQGVVPLDDYQC